MKIGREVNDGIRRTSNQVYASNFISVSSFQKVAKKFYKSRNLLLAFVDEIVKEPSLYDVTRGLGPNIWTGLFLESYGDALSKLRYLTRLEGLHFVHMEDPLDISKWLWDGPRCRKCLRGFKEIKTVDICNRCDKIGVSDYPREINWIIMANKPEGIHSEIEAKYKWVPIWFEDELDGLMPPLLEKYDWRHDGDDSRIKTNDKQEKSTKLDRKTKKRSKRK